MSTTSADYWQHVTTTAEEISALPEDERNDRLWEECDGSYWVIYTHAATAALQHSENESAGFEEMGSEVLDGCDSYAKVMRRLAFHALRADISNRVEW